MAPKAKAASKATAGRKAATTDKRPEQIKGHGGKEEAKKLASMTSAAWKELQKGMKEKWPQPSYIVDDPQPERSHTSYRDETYELVTRWMAETKIQYRPHAKAPGSKSHVRYEKYSKAKTVGQALKLGSWPADWCWDFERGFIKVLGPVRDEPIDPVNCFDTKALTEVDKCIYGWSVKELAKKCGLSLQDLRDDASSGESAIMRAHRLVSQRTAKAALSAAKAEGRRVTDDEVLKTLQEWGFARNANRNNVMPDGRDWVWSDTLGLMRDRIGSIHLTKATWKYPEVSEIINKWVTDRLPAEVKDFKFTSLNLNKNYAAKQHRDGNNFGPSMIAAFGKFTGGALKYWPEDNKELPLEKVEPKPCERLQLGAGMALFNGNCAHAVEKFGDGEERFSVVYFTAGCHAKAYPEDVSTLRELGMPYPSADEDPHALLRAPVGYAPGAAKNATSKLPAVRYWPRATVEKRSAVKPQKLAPKELKAWEARCVAISKKNFGRRTEGAADGDAETPEKAQKKTQAADQSGAKKRRASVAAAGAPGKKMRRAMAGA